MHGTGHKGKLPPVVERASSGCAGHGGDGSGIARRREGFWFQRSESREASANPDFHMPGFGFFSLFGLNLPHPCPTFSTIAAKSVAPFLKGHAWLFPSPRRVRESRERSVPVPSRSVQPDAPVGLASAPCAQPILSSPADQPPR